MGRFTFECTQVLPAPLGEVFPFFSDPKNLQAITPPWLDFRILSGGDLRMREGLRIDYRLRIHGFPIRWQSEITVWNPPWRFIDEQRRGPYRLWIHEHVFEDRGEATVVRDRVVYDVLGGALIRRLFVARDIENIFAFRQKRLLEIFPGGPAAPPAWRSSPAIGT